MKRTRDEMRPDYKRSDFKKLERGKFYAEAARGTSVALIDPTIAQAFPTSRDVNEALHALLSLMRRTARITRRSSGRAKARR